MRGASTLKRVSRSRSLVGRVARPGGATSVRGTERSGNDAHRNQHSGSATGPRPNTINYVCEAGQFRWAAGWASKCASTPFSRCWRWFAWASAPRTAWRAAWGCSWCWWRRCGARDARLLVAAWLGLRLRAILLLPIGGMFAYADPESQENANQGGGQFAMALAGPLANLATALMLAAAFLGASGDMRLFNQPFITSASLLRSMVWMQAGWECCTCCRPIRWTLAADPGQLCPQARLRSRRTRRRRPGPGAGAGQPWWAACCCTIPGSSSPASSS
jgi:hypothetical protein